MTLPDRMLDASASWHACIRALRMLAVLRLEVWPREDEPVDLVLMARIG